MTSNLGILLLTGIVFVLQLLGASACANFLTYGLAEAGCVGEFERFPVNGTQGPFKCSDCGSGLICPGGICPPVSSTVEEFTSPICPVKYTTTTDDYSCAALQKHCEDMGEGYLLYSKVFFYEVGSRFSCSNCTGFFNVEIDDELEKTPEGLEVEASLLSPFMGILFLSAFGLLVAGLVIECKGRRIQDEAKSTKDVRFDVFDWEVKRFFGHVDSHGKPRALTELMWGEAIVLRYIAIACCCCCKKKKAEMVDERDEIEKEEDRLYDTTFFFATFCLSLAVAYLLNGLSAVQIQCELSYPSDIFLIGVADSKRLDPFLGSPPRFFPSNTSTIFPKIIEDERHLLTLFEKVEASNNVISNALAYDIVVEEAVLIAFLVGLEKFLRGCEEMKDWDINRIHVTVRVVVFIYAAGAIAFQQVKFDVDAVLGFTYVMSNFFFVVVVLTVLLPLVGLARWVSGVFILRCLGKTVQGATCRPAKDVEYVLEADGGYRQQPKSQLIQRQMDSAKVSL